jgi:hypothetical protein
MIRDKINKLSKGAFFCYFVLLFIAIHIVVVMLLPNGAFYLLGFSSASASVVIAYFLSWVFKRKKLKYYDPVVLYFVSAICTIVYQSFFYYDQFGNVKLIGLAWIVLSIYFFFIGFKNDNKNT